MRVRGIDCTSGTSEIDRGVASGLCEGRLERGAKRKTRWDPLVTQHHLERGDRAIVRLLHARCLGGHRAGGGVGVGGGGRDKGSSYAGVLRGLRIRRLRTCGRRPRGAEERGGRPRHRRGQHDLRSKEALGRVLAWRSHRGGEDRAATQAATNQRGHIPAAAAGSDDRRARCDDRHLPLCWMDRETENL